MADATVSPAAPVAAKPKAWTDWVAVSTAVIAVIAAVTSAQAGGKGSRTIILQSQESDQWAYYQAKSIKGHTVAMQAELMGLLPPDPTLDAQRKELQNKHLHEVARYDAEKKEISDKAEALKAERLDTSMHGGRFGMALIFLQVSIVLSSVAGLTKKKWLWLLSLGLGVAGIGYFCFGYFF